LVTQPVSSASGFLGLTPYHWLVIAAGWAGWGFDVFDAVLFNFVAPECIPQLLQLPPGSRAAHEAAVFWTGALTSILLVGWAAGGVLFGWIADRIGRKRALFATIALYAGGTALCALVTNIPELIACRALASLGIGGEWGIGAALVAEAVPENRRVAAGVIMQTASPLGVVLASGLNYLIAGVWFAADPHHAWRYVFLAGLLPMLVALAVRVFLRESERWQAGAARAPPATPAELFAAPLRRATVSGVFTAVVAVLGWWGCNAFIPLLGRLLGAEHAAGAGLTPAAARLLASTWQAHASNAFNFGGLLGALAALPLAQFLGRRAMFMAYFLFAAGALFATFGLELAPETRISMLFVVGVGVYGVFGGFTFYLPELFPSRLRATGAGLCYNIGRVVAAAGPVVVGSITARAGGSSAALMQVLFWLALVPLGAALLAPRLILETRGRTLPA
jgi:MFS family permease